MRSAQEWDGQIGISDDTARHMKLSMSHSAHEEIRAVTLVTRHEASCSDQSADPRLSEQNINQRLRVCGFYSRFLIHLY